MELLLLLSAFLTALTGAFTGARAPDAVQRIACAPPAAAAVSTADVTGTVVPAQVRRDCPPPPAYRTFAPITVAASVPLYLGRLRV